ncbi:MAG: hypothetical protein N2B04_04610 [Psychrobacter sp.]
MTNKQIKEIALANGFKLKEQPNGEMDLNPYVYDFALKLLNKQNVLLFNDMKAGMHYVSGYGHKQYKEAINHCLDIIQESNEPICAELDKRAEVTND